MPRRNNQPKHKIFKPATNEASKVRYTTRAEAEAAIKQARIYQQELELKAYKSPYDKFWYLTSL